MASERGSSAPASASVRAVSASVGGGSGEPNFRQAGKTKAGRLRLGVPRDLPPDGTPVRAAAPRATAASQGGPAPFAAGATRRRHSHDGLDNGGVTIGAVAPAASSSSASMAAINTSAAPFAPSQQPLMHPLPVDPATFFTSNGSPVRPPGAPAAASSAGADDHKTEFAPDTNQSFLSTAPRFGHVKSTPPAPGHYDPQRAQGFAHRASTAAAAMAADEKFGGGDGGAASAAAAAAAARVAVSPLKSALGQSIKHLKGGNPAAAAGAVVAVSTIKPPGPAYYSPAHIKEKRSFHLNKSHRFVGSV